jgi:hypothetical protein
MRKSHLLSKIAIVALVTLAATGCKKENGIDNDNIIKKPYGLYAGEFLGALLNTNDGENYRTIFPSDGYPYRAITTSDENLLFVKANVHLSENNGNNFNPTYLFASPVAHWQTMILDVPSQDRVYLASNQSTSIALSEDHGKTWVNETQWDTGIVASGITSFTELKNGVLFAHGMLNDSIYRKDNRDDKWTWTNSNGLPAPGGGYFYLGHFNNALTLTDITGQNAVYYSVDSGKNWTKYNGLPVRPLYASSSPFDQVLLVGTDSMGVYRLENGVFIPSNNGLETNTSVFAFAAKENIYKNDASKKFVYIATNKGLYRSEDLGQNWARVKLGNFVAVY